MKSPIIDEYKCGCVITGDKLGIITWDKCAIHSKAPEMYEALKEIAKGEGAYNHDPLEHAGNVIDNLKSLAASALEGL